MRHDLTHYKYEGTKHTISFNNSTSVQQTNAISEDVYTVRLVSDQDCYVVFEDKDTASATTGLTVKAGVVEYFAVTDGSKLSALGVSASGSLEISEMTS